MPSLAGIEHSFNSMEHSFNHRNRSNPDTLALERFAMMSSGNLMTRSAVELGAAGLADIDLKPDVVERQLFDATSSSDLGLGMMSLEGVGSECVVCLERVADSALYTCGHMCMCYTCAQEIVRKPNALCPICRQPIFDVIKIFRS